MANSPSPQIDIYHIEGRRSFRVAWLCEELDLPYRLLFEAGDIRSSMIRLRKEYPLMPMAPTVKLNGQWIVESGAILDVLTARYGRGRLAPPIESPDYPRHAQWMHYAEATAMCRMATDRFIALALGIDVDQVAGGYRVGADIAKPALVGSRGIFDYVEDYLSHHPYFGGEEFSAADIMMHYAVRGARLLVWIDPEEYPHVAAWKRKVEARPAFGRAVKACLPNGSDEYGLPVGQPLPFSPPPSRASG